VVLFIKATAELSSFLTGTITFFPKTLAKNISKMNGSQNVRGSVELATPIKLLQDAKVKGLQPWIQTYSGTTSREISRLADQRQYRRNVGCQTKCTMLGAKSPLHSYRSAEAKKGPKRGVRTSYGSCNKARTRL
jgi:hypothetical protein